MTYLTRYFNTLNIQCTNISKMLGQPDSLFGDSLSQIWNSIKAIYTFLSARAENH